MESVLLFLLFVAALLLLMTTGTPVAVALGLIGVVGTLYVATPAQLVRLAQIAFTRSSDFVFIVIPLFIAGIIPGIVLAVMLSLTVVLMVLRRPDLAPATAHVTWSERWQSLGKVWPTAILSVVVLGSIYTGVATPTEAAAIGAGGAI